MTTDGAGDLLAELMDARGYSGPKVAELTGGLVAPSTVRTYVRGEVTPRASYAIAIARLFDPVEGADLLEAWNYPAAARHLRNEAATADELIATVGPDDGPSYAIEQSSSLGARTVPIGWKTEIEVVATTETSYGIEWTCRTTSGTLLRVIPIYRIDLAPDFRLASPKNDTQP